MIYRSGRPPTTWPRRHPGSRHFISARARWNRPPPAFADFGPARVFDRAPHAWGGRSLASGRTVVRGDPPRCGLHCDPAALQRL